VQASTSRGLDKSESVGAPLAFMRAAPCPTLRLEKKTDVPSPRACVDVSRSSANWRDGTVPAFKRTMSERRTPVARSPSVTSQPREHHQQADNRDSPYPSSRHGNAHQIERKINDTRDNPHDCAPAAGLTSRD